MALAGACVQTQHESSGHAWFPNGASTGSAYCLRSNDCCGTIIKCYRENPSVLLAVNITQRHDHDTANSWVTYYVDVQRTTGRAHHSGMVMTRHVDVTDSVHCLALAHELRQQI